ncbi:MAG: Zn-ribbon domain-containing OB-fold protein [Chloroflexi bacterium]|nr:Zn-ribbon domain-containing OB-fold protein [Chloroflexota bacterium]
MEISRNWRLQKQRYGLVGEVCEHCGSKIFPPRDVCPACAEEAKTLYQFSGKGEIYSYTTVYDAPDGYEEQAPYTVAIVKLEEGPLVTAQLTDVDNGKVEIGQQVEMVTRKLREDGERGVLVYGYKFRPSWSDENLRVG